MRNINRLEPPYMCLVQTQELAAGEVVVVHDIENFSLGSLLQSRKHNRIRTVIDIGKRYCIRSAEMQKHTKSTDPDPATYSFIARSIDMPGPKRDTRDPELVTILGDDLVLFD